MTDAAYVRRTDVDALRVLATGLLFPFHVAMIFNPAPFYHVRNDELSILAMVFAGFVSLWHMPLFFVLAGWSAVASLRARGAARFAWERVTRLLVPLAIGCVLFAPSIKYIELRGGQDLNHRGLFVSPQTAESYRSILPQPLPLMEPFDETFREFVPSFFTDLDRFSWSHLWFLAYLFALSLAWLPFLSRLAHGRRDREAQPAGRAVSALTVYLPILPLALVQVTMRPRWPGIQNLYDDWANVAYYSIFLLVGAVLAARPAFEEAVHRERGRAAFVSVVALGALLGAVLGLLRSDAIILALTAVAGWSFVVTILGFAAHHSPRPSATLDSWSEASMPLYVLHQPAIVFLAYFVVAWPLPSGVKLVFVLLGSVALTVGAYRFLVRPISPLRVAFGMKPLARPLSRRGAGVAACPIVVAFVTFTAAAPAHSGVASPEGLWWAEGGAAKVRIERCGASLCGRVVWLRSPFDERGCRLRDRYNSDPSLRNREVIGLEIVRDLVSTDPNAGEWHGGNIYDPTSGRTYTCELRMRDADRLELRGYLGLRFLGRTVTWIRVGGEERICRD